MGLKFSEIFFTAIKIYSITKLYIENLIISNPPSYSEDEYNNQDQTNCSNSSQSDCSSICSKKNAFPVIGFNRINDSKVAREPTIHQPLIVNSECLRYDLGRRPHALVCQFCERNITTSIRYQNGESAWFLAAILCMFG